LLQKVAYAACPPGERSWLEAIFAEAEAIGPRGERASWLFGIVSLLFFANYRAGKLAAERRLLPLLAITFAGAAFFAVSSRTYEVPGVDDDFFIGAAGSFRLRLCHGNRDRSPKAPLPVEAAYSQGLDLSSTSTSKGAFI
jgi:hypothetical protein